MLDCYMHILNLGSILHLVYAPPELSGRLSATGLAESKEAALSWKLLQ